MNERRIMFVTRCFEIFVTILRGSLGGSEHRNTAKKIAKYRNTAKKFAKYRNTAMRSILCQKSIEYRNRYFACSLISFFFFEC